MKIWNKRIILGPFASMNAGPSTRGALEFFNKAGDTFEDTVYVSRISISNEGKSARESAICITAKLLKSFFTKGLVVKIPTSGAKTTITLADWKNIVEQVMNSGKTNGKKIV